MSATSRGRGEIPAHRYLPHLDGIRAIAVLAVVLFHLVPAACPGGFVGVDVFFVLSGFLVTGRVLADAAEGRFSIAEFYHRRIRRILPAYTALILAVFLAGCALFHAVLLVHLADATVMATLFAANVYFEKTSTAYFGHDDLVSPLLHLWSLGVEEQFYLVLPLLGVAVARRRGWLPAAGVVLLWVASFVAATWAVADGRVSRAFYLSPYRGWELLSGALLAIAARRAGRVGPSLASFTGSSAAFLGLALLASSYAFLASSTPFPGAAALLPVAGTVLLAWFGAVGPVSRVLSASWAVAVGKVSYSLYLWHWPVFVFWRYATYDEVGPAGLAGMVGLSTLLSVASWRWIEEPPRRSPQWGRSRSFGFAAASMVLLVSIGVACAFGKGWPDLLHPAANRLQRADYVEQFVESFLRNLATRAGRRSGVELLSRPELPKSVPVDGARHLGSPGRTDLFLVGDSHAACLAYGIDREFGTQGLGADTYTMHSVLAYADPAVLGSIEASRSPKVLVAQYWTSPRYDREEMLDGLTRFALAMASQGRKLYIATDVPLWPVALGDIRARMAIVSPPEMKPEWSGVQTEEAFRERQADINRRIEEIASRTGATVVPLQDVFRWDGAFHAIDERNDPPVLLFQDRSHLSPEGSLRAGPFLLRWLGFADESVASMVPGDRLGGGVPDRP